VYERFHGLDALNILETGTIRNADPQYALDDGWSTVHFAEWILEHPQANLLTSIDLDCAVARQVLRDRGLVGGVAFLQGHSIAVLGEILKCRSLEPGGDDDAMTLAHPNVHLAYLDSDNDPTLILAEYLLVKQLMPSGAILMVDDVDLSPNATARKGHAIAPWLARSGQEYTIVTRTGAGYSTGVLITRIP
jgi:hypothetical protein